MRGLINKGVFLSGGTSGIGFAAAKRFLEEGARVFVSGLEPEEVAITIQMLAPLGPIAGAPMDV